MIFSLEALNAERGDSLIVHFGKPDSPRFIVIDGGPSPVYEESLKPRLEQLHKRWAREDDGKLDIEMAMVSHIDDDHIQGVLDWIDELAKSDPLPYNILTLWYNSFDDVLGNGAEELRSRLASVADEALRPHSAAVVAGVKNGRTLRAQAKQLGIPLNQGFKGLVSSVDGKAVVKMGSGLTLRVLCPSMRRLEALQKEWDKYLRALPKAKTAELAAFTDQSVTNLSSIVVLAEMNGKRMLLTGDARGDDILEALESAGLMEDDQIHVDVFKIPHHGSNRDSALELYQKITADHYVISANGEYDNPDVEIFEWIAKARGRDRYNICITNKKLYDPKKKKDVGEAVQDALDANPAPGRKVIYRKNQDLSVRVDLEDKVEY